MGISLLFMHLATIVMQFMLFSIIIHIYIALKLTQNCIILSGMQFPNSLCGQYWFELAKCLIDNTPFDITTMGTNVLMMQ